MSFDRFGGKGFVPDKIIAGFFNSNSLVPIQDALADLGRRVFLDEMLSRAPSLLLVGPGPAAFPLRAYQNGARISVDE